MKKNRTKAYFIDAGKQIVLEEGVHQVTVRKIAELAGYSYGSIYNYYADLDALLCEVKQALIADIMTHMGEYMQDQTYTREDIKTQNRKFVTYFMDNPNVYDFLYNYHIESQCPSMFDDIEIGETGRAMYDGLIADGAIQKADVPVISKTMIYGFYGLLSLYFSSNGMTRETVQKDLDEMADYLLSPRK